MIVVALAARGEFIQLERVGLCVSQNTRLQICRERVEELAMAAAGRTCVKRFD